MIDYKELLLEALLLENQLAYLTKKYPEIDPALIQQAIELDRRSAEKLVFGLKTGVITDLGPDSVAAVADLDPLAKVSNKSESELEYDRAVRAAKEINPKYWQWVLRVKRADPNAQIDEGIFHYLEDEGLDSADIIDMTLDEIQQKSDAWHRQQYTDQEFRGTYKFTPEKNAVFTVGSYAFVPVDTDDARIEGGKMQNCIGGACYPSATTRIYSLRNKYNNPHVSISVNQRESPNEGGKIWMVSEIKGKQNRVPIEKYVKYVLPFLEFLAKKNVDVTSTSDLWALPSPDLVQLIKYHKGPITTIPERFLNIISDDTFNKLALNNGRWDKVRDSAWLTESFVKRLYEDTILRAFDKDFPLAADSKQKLLKSVLKYSKIDEETAKSLLEKSGTTRSVKIMLQAKYNPGIFLEELKKVHPQDFALAYANYIDGIEAYPYEDGFFGVLMRALITDHYNVDKLIPAIKILAAKTISADLMEINNGIKGRVVFGTYNQNATTYVHIIIIQELLSRISDKNIDAYRLVFDQMADGFPFDNQYDKRIFVSSMDIIFSVPFKDLRELGHISERMPEFHAKFSQFIKNIFNAGDEDQTVIPGTTADVRDATAFILNTDDREALLDLRRTTKSRGVKIMVDRKLARLNRINANARANEPAA